MKRRLTAEEIYWRRVDTCTRASIRAAKAVGLDGGATPEYQGCEFQVRTQEHADAKVVVLMETGYAPRLPKFVRLVVHGVVWRRVNSKVAISGGGLASCARRFLPDRISQAWLENAIERAAAMLKEVCTTENIGRLAKKGLAARREQIRNGRRIYDVLVDPNGEVRS